MFYFGCNACKSRWGIGEARTCTCEKEKPTREWVGLTDDERKTISEANNMLVDDDLFDEIEAKLKEKNQ